jgi:hypothetical protein
MRHKHSGGQTGSATIAIIVAVIVCGGLSSAVLLTNAGRSRLAKTEADSERALQLAEAGADWATTRIRIANGTVPVASETGSIAGVGSYTISYTQGNANGVDDNGDGVVDDIGEKDYAVVLATGSAGTVKRTVRIVLRKAVITPTFEASLQLNVTSPILDLSGNALMIDGRDHLLDGTYDPTGIEKYGIASPAAAGVLSSQVPALNNNNVIGLGGDPSLGVVPPIQLNGLVDQVRAAAGIIVPTGTQTNLALGTPVPGSTVNAYCPGNLKLTANNTGAGILAVDGDLEISGAFQWVGIIVVRGQVTLTGGGGAKHIIGALAVGQDVTATTSTQTVDLTGTVDVDYSSTAVTLASDSLAVMTLQSWREVANP